MTIADIRRFNDMLIIYHQLLIVTVCERPLNQSCSVQIGNDVKNLTFHMTGNTLHGMPLQKELLKIRQDSTTKQN